MTIYINK